MANLALVGHRVICFKTVIWSIYPVVSALRWMGVISSWTEQVLLFSTLDVVAKAITFSAIVACRAILWLAHINGSMQLVMASHNFLVPVNDEWELLVDEGHPLIMSMLISASQSESYETTSLLSLCMSDNDRQKLRDAAYHADTKSLNSPPPKVSIELRCESQAQATRQARMEVEVHVSKLFYGRRVIGMLKEGQGNVSKATLGACDSDSPLEYGPSPTSTARSNDSEGPSEPLTVQMTLGLHNCCKTLELSPTYCSMLTLLFQMPSMACTIFVWSQATTAIDPPTTVVASKRLQSEWFPEHPMPQTLNKLFPEDCVARIINALKIPESSLHQWSGMTTCGGVATTVAAVPLNRLSRSGATADVQLCLLAVGVGITDTTPTEPKYTQWKPVQGSLVALGEATVTAVTPPHMLVPLASATAF
eukprot:CAMPEP_0172784466 /NCGR_PEP_ID=MMETSP1074-20121228/204956_1 /TAXON_ID=2916 /ORGANISM="Ceratium fusus, Strain PA161109" /LENGTH=420 /DNA_ID=CAMNT_0013621469 /DNA_START=425 /DNA_END=1687 /DNA_ORIENTATION=-